MIWHRTLLTNGDLHALASLKGTSRSSNPRIGSHKIQAQHAHFSSWPSPVTAILGVKLVRPELVDVADTQPVIECIALTA
jgi:hypothetical protein